MMRARAGGCVRNVTVLLLSLMSHQCTQRASVFSKPEYINTSVYQVILRLREAKEAGGIAPCNIFFFVESLYLTVFLYFYFLGFRGLSKLLFLKQLF